MQESKPNTKVILVIFFIAINFSFLKAQEPDPASFFPSAVGNVWEYSTQTSTYKNEIIKDSVDATGNRFLFYPSILYAGKPQIEIDTSLNVYQLDFIIRDSVLLFLYKLNADSGETWISETRYNKMARVDAVFQSNIFGKLRDVKNIGYYRPAEGDTTITENAELESYILLASGIGEYYEYRSESGPERILLGCVIDGDTLGTITSVKASISEIPANYKLYQNYPNPFNPSTTIKFEIPVSSEVKLSVYNILGEEVKVLINEYMYRGVYNVKFERKSSASGIYIYVLKAGSNVYSKKMILIK